jgi:hypothetical protein
MSFKVEWLKDHHAIGRKAGETFDMDDRSLFEAWRDDGLCKEVKAKKSTRAAVTKPASAKVTK